MNRGGVGARSLNIELQKALNPAGERKVERFGWTFAPGDKVMQIENDYDKEVYNGDIGFVTDVEPEEGELTASFDGRSVTYGFSELDTLVPAYAATIHKSQGSEYPAVVIPVMTQHYAMLQRNLLYTGVTRGKRLVVLVGQKKAIAIAVRNVSGRRRWSKLGMAACWPSRLAADRHGGLSHGRQRIFSYSPNGRRGTCVPPVDIVQTCGCVSSGCWFAVCAASLGQCRHARRPR
jgi:exodeoxyribonuclease V alpha subunit